MAAVFRTIITGIRKCDNQKSKSSPSFQASFLEHILRGVKGIGQVPGIIPRIPGAGRVFEDMEFLGRHITLGQQETGIPIPVHGHVGNHDTVPGAAAFDEHVAGLKLVRGYGGTLLIEG